MDVVVHQDRGGAGAVAQAVDRLEREVPVGGCLAGLYAQGRLGVREEALGAHGLAGLRAADADDVPAGRMRAEVVIEANDPVYFRAGDVERFSDDRDSLGRNMAQTV